MWLFYILLGVIAALIGLIIAAATPGAWEGYFVIGTGLILFVLGILNGNASRKKKITLCEAEKAEQEKRRNLGSLWADKLPHTTGLPLAEGTECSIYYLSDKLIFEGGGTSFTLPLERLNDISITTSEELQKSYVSSIGGAVGGAILFGPLGALIGGRAKEKTSKIITSYLVFTYLKDDEVKYIAFDNTNQLARSQELKKLFDSNPKITQEITL